MALTKEQIQKHIEDPWTCPFCGESGEDVFEPVPPPEGWTWEDLDGRELMQRVHCRKCGKSWRNYYKIHDIEEEDADGCAIDNEEGSGSCAICQTETTYSGSHNGDYPVWICPTHGGTKT